MNIFCPCGRNCPGVDAFGRAPDCYQSYTGTDLPSRFIPGDGILGSILGGAMVGFAQGILQPSYEIYQCPTCGCEVAFMTWDDSRGTHLRRIGDLKNC
jgi:hypothetical protein